MKVFLRIIGATVVVLVATVLWLYCLLSTREKAFNTYLAQLRGQGEKLTFQELTAAYSTPSNHSFASLSNLVVTLGPAPGDLGSEHLAQFIAPDRAQVTWSLAQPPRLIPKEGRTNGSWADLAGQLRAATPSLLSLQKMLKETDANIGPRANTYETPSLWSQVRTAATWLAYATLADLHDGKRDGALASIQALADLANLHREEAVLPIQMTRVAVSRLGLDLTWEALQLGNWNDEQLASLQRSWESLDLLAGSQKAIEGERSLFLEMVGMARDGRWPNNPTNSRTASSAFTTPRKPYPRALLYNDALYGFHYLQAEVGLSRQFNEGQPFGKIIQSFRAKNAEVEAKSHTLTRVFYLLSLLCLPNYTKAIEWSAHTEMRRRLAVVAIALRRYEVKNGQPPPNLEALSPEFLRTVPRDGMDGKALKYRLNSDGTFALYSAGLDGRDDGGDPTPINSDLTKGILQVRDVVWPVAIKPARGRLAQKISR